MMRPQDYRRAVGSIRWTPEQRRAIEAKLRAPVTDETENRSPAETETIRTPIHYNIYEEQEARMKKERKQARMYLLILAAALLTIGGTVAAVAWSSRKPQDGSSQAEESKPETKKQKNENSITEDDLTEAVISPKLTDQQDEPECHGYSKTGKGFYFYGSEQGMVDKETGYNGSALRYYDEASGETVYVCAKPNCLHDGNDFCTATTKIYTPMSDPVYLDGYVYEIAIDEREFLEKKEQCEKFPTVLLRYAPDGTEITQLAVLNEDSNALPNQCDLIAHRGQLWMYCSYVRVINTYDENMDISAQDSSSKYDISCYEPEKQKVTVLASSGEMQKNYRTWYRGARLKGVGDYVYFHKYQQDWRDKLKGCGVFRIECSTGQIEQLINLKADYTEYYTVAGDYVYYTYGREKHSLILHAYNLQTGEDNEISGLIDLAKSQAAWFDPEMLDDQVYLYPEALLADAEHVYVAWQFVDQRKEHMDEDHPDGAVSDFITELDHDGKILHTVNIRELKNVAYPEEYIRSELAANGYKKDEKTFIKPEELTEADIQDAIEHHWKTTVQVDEEYIRYDGADFYLYDYTTLYRISREELFGDMNAKPLLYLRVQKVR